MTPSQTRAVKQFRAFMERQLCTNPEYKDTLTRFETQPTEYGSVWIMANTDMLGLPESNLLRVLDRQHWMALVGKHGALTVWQAPKSFAQFRGGRAFGMAFKKL